MRRDPWAHVARIAAEMRYGSETACRVLAMDLLNLAREQEFVEASAGQRRPYRANPGLIVWPNPGTYTVEIDGPMSERVYEVRYRHVEDGANYKHVYQPDVQMVACHVDGTRAVVIRGGHGQSVWGDY